MSATVEALSQEREEGMRARLEAATPGPWEPGDVWLVAGLLYSDGGERVNPGDATRCAYCHLGEPSWSGRRDINGTVMPAHRHRNPEPYDVEHAVSSADGGLVAYEGGGIVRGEDAQFVASAREDIPVLLAEVVRLRAEVAAARKFAGEMRDFCSPHGVAVDYAERLLEAMDRARLAGLPPGVREVRIVVQAPSDENADQWAETIRDLVVAEYGDSMRLEVAILPEGPR